MRLLIRGEVMNFIEKNTKKVALILGVATAACTVTTVYAANGVQGFHTTVSGTVYKQDSVLKTGWLFLEEGTFYFNVDGIMQTGWQTIDDGLYYFNAEGNRLDGVQVIDGHKYTFQKGGRLLTGWQDDNTTYYDQYGEYLVGLQQIDGKTYNFGEDGKIQTGWITVNNKKVYFTKAGYMAVSETDVDGQKYNFNADGSVKSGWEHTDNGIRYFDERGFVVTGWQDIEGNKYYFDTTEGYAITDAENENWIFDENGVATPNEKEEEEDTATATTAVNGSSSSKTTTATSSAITGVAGAAQSQLGVYQDCTALVSKSLAANGIYFHGWPADYMSLGTIVSAGEAQAGDILYYANGGTGVAHVAVYVGNGQAVHGGWAGNQTVQTSAYVGSGPVFIRVNK